ncbi:MAG: bifunctional tetrahydrofolate synthase/dihydrofolate synthase [Pseudomonadota bacterium]|nr:bifunctional tetrahydrofolate synthase/dihydrofolate synthase [Pseudomonadota bacterium]
MRFDSLSDWLAWQESLHGQEIDMGLTRIRLVAERMNLLAPAGQVVTVAGTNGKGSCVATLEALCIADNKSVGAFTSPHLFQYNERIRINGKTASDEEICQSFQRIDVARGDITLTYFEFGALAAIDIFTRHQLDVLLLEVGLGGRLDAVNIIDADVAVVTSIALDHEAWLGSDRSVIGREKAGIYRAGRPAICADINAPESVRQVALELAADWHSVGDSFDWQECNGRWQWRSGELQYLDLPVPQLPHPSVAAALFAYLQLGFALPDVLPQVMADLKLSGRMQTVCCTDKSVILDVAHNPAAAGHLADYLNSKPVQGRTLALVAMMADKDIAGVFQPLLDSVDAWHVSGLPGNDRAASAEDLRQTLSKLGVPVSPWETVTTAIEQLLPTLEEADRLLVFGSFFTVADAQTALDGVESQANL